MTDLLEGKVDIKWLLSWLAQLGIGLGLVFGSEEYTKEGIGILISTLGGPANFLNRRAE